MRDFKYLIIGGGVAGTSAAEAIRSCDRKSSIAIVSDEPYPLYSKVMLSKPNYFLGKIKEEQIFLKTPQWYQKQKIELITEKKAVKLDSKKKIISLDNGEEVGYKKLLLAVGGCPRKWPTPGAEKEGVLYLRTLDDYRKIKESLEPGKHIVTIGGGFISFEMCDILRLAGYDVTLIIRESHYWDPLLDEVSGRIIEEALENGGVKILRSSEVDEILGESKVEGVLLKDGSKIACDLIVCGIGIVCPLDWIKEAGVETGRGIMANEYLETSVPDIWTAGDVAEYKDLILEEQVQMGNWLNAQTQGRVAGLNMAGKKEAFRLVSSYTTQGFGITVTFVGDPRPMPDRVVIPRGTAESKSYGRIIVMDDEVVGATLINRAAELPAIAKLIEKDVKVAGLEDRLGDPNFDLNRLLVSV